ncbi:MAG: hypothetical protein HY296_08390 [Thaumarchaeota archaeon]|nr:hypothetical protein [Nitrososphaerota archaeon]
MKRIHLVLFTLLGAATFALPNYPIQDFTHGSLVVLGTVLSGLSTYYGASWDAESSRGGNKQSGPR